MKNGYYKILKTIIFYKIQKKYLNKKPLSPILYNIAKNYTKILAIYTTNYSYRLSI